MSKDFECNWHPEGNKTRFHILELSGSFQDWGIICDILIDEFCVREHSKYAETKEEAIEIFNEWLHDREIRYLAALQSFSHAKRQLNETFKETK